VADLLTRQGWHVLITGVEREAATVAEVAAQAPGARTLVGATTLPEYAALVERAATVVCNNSLPLHLADALHTPLVVLYSGTDLEEQWRPREAPARLLRRPTPCHPCYLFTCPIGQPCLDIAPEEVVAAVAEVVAAQGPRLPEAAGIATGGRA
jgi:ADP-heptose:LPS heptosyltransferase